MSSGLVMGIDPSTHTGVAVSDLSGKVIYTKEIEFPKKTGFDRASALVGDVFDVHRMFNPDSVVIESVIVGHASSALVVIQIATILRYFLWQEGINYLEVAPSVLKKFVCGVGNAKKEQMMMWVSKKYGFESATNNIADAVGLSMFGVYALTGVGSAEEKALIKKVLAPAPKQRKSRS